VLEGEELEIAQGISDGDAEEGGDLDLGRLGSRVVELDGGAPGPVIDHDLVGSDENALSVDRVGRRGEEGESERERGPAQKMVTVSRAVAV